MMAETPCRTGRCGYGEPCRCAFYAAWIVPPPAPPLRRICSGQFARGYREGHSIGYAAGYHAGQHDREREPVA